jgi:hypothetical protein
MIILESQCCDGFYLVRDARQIVGGCMRTEEGWYFQPHETRPMRMYFESLDVCVSALLSYKAS